MFRGVILICKLTSYTCKTELSCRLCNLIFSGIICGLRVRSMPLVKTNGNEFCLNRTRPPSTRQVWDILIYVWDCAHRAGILHLLRSKYNS